jgi:choline dehydrogenase-like flavoprotein
LPREAVDVCVIGSGAGGSVVAFEAARRGLRTLVLERGPRVEPRDMSDDELTMIPRLYKDGGLQLNASLDLFVMQGACVGGSTVLSNMVLLRPDEAVFDRWRRLGAAVDRAGIQLGMSTALGLLEAELAPIETTTATTRLFFAAGRALGHDVELMTKALGECRACGYCNVGCTFGTKRDALATYVRWAEARGARVLDRADVVKLEPRRGRIDRAIVALGRQREPLEVRARLFVLAAGAIGSSALLLSSGIKKNVGTRVSFNAGSMMIGEFDEPLRSFDGDQMSVYLKTPDALIEATHNPLMSSALCTPGFLDDHARLMQRHAHLAYAGALVGTEASGRVYLSRLFGTEEVSFRMSPRDLRRLGSGLRTIGEILFEAGARRVILPTHRYLAVDDPRGLDVLDRVLRSSRALQLGSAHPQGGNPMSDDPDLGVVDSRLRAHGLENLFVCDASVFPEAVDVNPILSILGLVHSAAPRMLDPLAPAVRPPARLATEVTA